MSLFRSAFKWAPLGKTAVPAAKATAAAKLSEKTSPPLVLLVSDASGRASFQMHKFPDVAAAKNYVEFWFPRQQDGGVIAFWAMESEPKHREHAEPVVLIKDTDKPGVVYLFSFVDMAGAQDFVQSEKDSGVEEDAIMVYWAASVHVEVDDAGALQMSPEKPPTEAPDGSARTREVRIEKPFEPQPAAGWARVIGRPVQASARVEDLVVAAAVEEVVVAAVAQPAPAASAAPVVKVPVVEAEIEPVAEPVTTVAPVVELVSTETHTSQVVARASRIGDESDGDEGFDESPDMGQQMAKLLGSRRWEARDEPFTGFDSPPGRF